MRIVTGNTATLLLFALVTVSSAVGSAPLLSAQQKEAPKPQNAPQNEPKDTAKPPATSLTGCVDEQEGRYILTDDRELTPIANLEADGFPQEGFAKHMGHKVTVRGTSSPGDPRPTFKVRSITMVSETCAPQQH